MISDDELTAARNNLSRAQERFGCYPDCEVGINQEDAYGRGLTFLTWLGRPDSGSEMENYLICSMPATLLRDILDRKVHWNNAEIGCLIRFDRIGPYLPDVHTLMSFFHLPRPS